MKKHIVSSSVSLLLLMAVLLGCCIPQSTDPFDTGDTDTETATLFESLSAPVRPTRPLQPSL